MMYLPTDAKTIYQVLIDAARKSRDYWLGALRDEPDNQVVRTSIEHLTGRIWALMDLRDDCYII